MPLEYRSPSSAGHANANRALRGETGIGDSDKLVAATTALKPIPTSRVVGAGPANVPPANAGSQRSRQPSRRDLLFVRDITGPGSCRSGIGRAWRQAEPLNHLTFKILLKVSGPP